MQEFNYRNRHNYLKLVKYTIGFIMIYALTIVYFLKERQEFNWIIGGGFLFLCVVTSVPFLKAFMQTFFESVMVSDDEIKYFRFFRVLTMPWYEVQYFIRLPARGLATGVVVYYEMGDLKRKIIFDSTIQKGDELIRVIQSKVGTLKKKRRTTRR